MAKLTPDWLLERQFNHRKARREALNNKHLNDATFKETVGNNPREKVVYHSLFLKKTSGTGDTATTNPLPFVVNASAKAINYFTAGTLGLGTTTTNVENAPVGFKPSKIHLTRGGNKVAKRTSWGSRYIQYTAPTSGDAQATYAAPISLASGAVFTEGDLETRVQAIATAKVTDIGNYGRVWLELEKYLKNFKPVITA